MAETIHERWQQDTGFGTPPAEGSRVLGRFGEGVQVFDPDQPRDPEGKWHKLPGYKGTPDWVPSKPTPGSPPPVTKPEGHELKAVGKFTDGWYKEMNEVLRGTWGDQMEDPAIRTYIGDLDSLIARQPPIEKPFHVWRGTRPSHFEGMKPGDEFTDQGFMSTSMDQARAEAFFKGNPDQNTMLEIALPEGMRVLDVDAMDKATTGLIQTEEQEVVLPLGTRFVFDGEEERQSVQNPSDWLHVFKMHVETET